MPEFRLIQISDTHLTRRHQKLTDNFHRVSDYIDAGRPDLVINSGDLTYDAPTDQLADGNINIDHMLDLAQHFFTKTRWERTFRRVLPYPLN